MCSCCPRYGCCTAGATQACHAQSAIPHGGACTHPAFSCSPHCRLPSPSTDARGARAAAGAHAAPHLRGARQVWRMWRMAGGVGSNGKSSVCWLFTDAPCHSVAASAWEAQPCNKGCPAVVIFYSPAVVILYGQAFSWSTLTPHLGIVTLCSEEIQPASYAASLSPAQTRERRSGKSPQQACTRWRRPALMGCLPCFFGCPPCLSA